VHLYDAATEIGGQFNMAKRIPGKEEFHETVRFFGKMIEKTGVKLHLNTPITADFLIAEKFEQVVLATGVIPRALKVEGINHSKVVSYLDVLSKNATVGQNVAIIGAGGIGFDVAMFLTTPVAHNELSEANYNHEWGIDTQNISRGGLVKPDKPIVPRKVAILQRSKGKVGDKLGKTTGWAHRLTLKNRGVQMLSEIEYEKIDDNGLHVKVKGIPQIFAVDTVVICAGQEPQRALQQPLMDAGITVHLIGGAKEAGELDAKRAIEEGLKVAIAI
jgi:2,4-dienoyl-CoA reductase (NADPH2)